MVALANQGQRMNWSLWLELHLHFCMLSLLAVGGALAIVPEMHRYLVNDLQLLSETAFSQSVTLAQIAPGPNILLVGVMGWNIGLQAAGGFEAGGVAMVTGLLMALTLLTAAVLPSSLLSYFMVKWLHLHQHAQSVRAFKAGMVPLVMGLMISAGWLLQTASNAQMDWRLLLVCIASMLIVLFTRVHLLWLMLGGALAGAVLGL
jgi:chromate transporter